MGHFLSGHDLGVSSCAVKCVSTRGYLGQSMCVPPIPLNAARHFLSVV